MTNRRGNSEGSIYKRASDGRYVASVTLPNGRRRVFYGKTRVEAAKKLQAAQRHVQDGLPIPSHRLTLGSYLDTWLEGHKQRVRHFSYKSYESNIRLHIKPDLGRMLLAYLEARHVEAFLTRKLESGLSPRTVQHMHGILRKALRQAEQWSVVPRNVARLVSPPRATKADIKPLSPVEVKKLLAAIKGDRLEALYTTALALGLRQGEALGLRWSDVSLETGTLNVRVALQDWDGQFVLAETKTVKSKRAIRLPDVCMNSLRSHKERQDTEKATVGAAWANKWDLVFAHEDGSPLSRHAVLKDFQRLLKRHGISKHRYHDLRHTAATLLLAQGVPLRVLQELLGHSQLATTVDVYSHVLPVLMADAAAKMDAALAA